jgi:UDP-N-acetylglucosamine/UDP-N-acetylgalactosamine diphosphorylase
MTDKVLVQKRLEAHGQRHLLAFYDQLPPDRQEALLEQAAALDLDRLDRLVERYVRGAPPTEITGRIEPAPIIPARPVEAEGAELHEQGRRRGEELLAAGKVAAFVVAGGQGTRLGYEGPKGCFEATAVTKKPLFQLFAEQILAASKRYGVSIPWYVMTSPANDVATRAFFRQHRFFGLRDKDVFFLVQGTMPAFDMEGKILLASRDQIALSPNGHGGSLLALRESGALADMAARGVELISYFQVDNPLTKVIDPLFLGLHDLRGSRMSAKVLPKRDPMEKLGNVCLVDGRVTVIEYSDMPEPLARECTEDGRLRFSAGSIAIHVLSRRFVEEITSGGAIELPYHRAIKKVPYIDAAGQLVKPDKPNAIKLEMFVFDALPLAKKAMILETVRSEEFSSIKNASGDDSLASSLHDQVRRAAAWLEQAGVRVPRDANGRVAAAIEISPLFADSPQELRDKVKDLKIATGDKLYLGSRGQMGGLK